MFGASYIQLDFLIDLYWCVMIKLNIYIIYEMEQLRPFHLFTHWFIHTRDFTSDYIWGTYAKVMNINPQIKRKCASNINVYFKY